ncbi:Thiol-disulfide oxidoreductase resA [Bacillus pseudomycoides]|nr:Thiol-disulfide oxidoreductase resA [Bacillus pseudomycoides]
MKKNRLLFRILILLILSVAVGFTLYQGFFVDKEKMQIGKKAPNFVVSDLEGKKNRAK